MIALSQDNMTVHQSIPNNSKTISDEQQMPAAAPLLSCSSQGSSGSSSVAPAICITGSFSNIEYKYHIDASRVLGCGQHGSVRECVNRATGRKFAVKSICKRDPEVKLGGLAREILLLREMEHDNVLGLVDVFETEEYVHLVTDLCRGGELFDRIVERSADDDGNACFSEEAAARIMRQVLAAVSYMHERNVVHRDIKPENILFENDDADSPVRIIDFGLSRKHVRGRQGAMSTLVGTPYYIAPEVLRRRYDGSCDLWSLGVIAYILLCGYPPFNGADDAQTHRRVLKGKYCFPVEEWENVSEDAVDFIQRFLRIDPRKRMTAEQALRHPWILKHCPADAMVINEEEERQDKSSVEVVYNETPRKRLPVQHSYRSPPSPPRKLRMSMFAF